MSRFSTILPLHVRFVLALASVKLLYPSLVCCLVGSLIFMHGIVVEASERHPLRHRIASEMSVVIDDRDRYDYPSLMEYVVKGLTGELAHESENMQVTAMTITYAGSLLGIALILTARAAWRMQVRMSPVAGRKSK